MAMEVLDPPAEKTQTRRILWIGVVLFLICAGLRLGLLNRQGLWADEVFSLAMATGHSLEHPADKADPSQGDYVEAIEPKPASYYRQYVEHSDPPVGLSRVFRAAFLTDTNPPLYDVLLHYWTRALGSTERALKLYSIFWSILTFPVLWSLARQLGGVRACVPVCAIYALAPFSLWYGTEGRMYSQMWFFAAVMMWATYKAHQSGRWPVIALWVLSGICGMLSHYFFSFIVAACAGWLLIFPGKFKRSWLIGACVLIAIAILPWYRLVPASMKNWRVTAAWLNSKPNITVALGGPAGLVPSFLSPRGFWGGRIDFELISLSGFAVATLWYLWSMRSRLLEQRQLLVLLGVAAAGLGPIVFDLAMGTYTAYVTRYAAAGLPAIFLFAGLALARLHPKWLIAVSLIIMVGWATGIRRCYDNPFRSSEPFREMGQVLTDQTKPDEDVIVVHSIPSGVAGIAMYTQTKTEMVSWVKLLGVHKAEHIPQIVNGKKRLALVRIHDMGKESELEQWLATNAKVDKREVLSKASVLFFVPKSGERFAATNPATTQPAN